MMSWQQLGRKKHGRYPCTYISRCKIGSTWLLGGGREILPPNVGAHLISPRLQYIAPNLISSLPDSNTQLYLSPTPLPRTPKPYLISPRLQFPAPQPYLPKTPIPSSQPNLSLTPIPSPPTLSSSDFNFN